MNNRGTTMWTTVWSSVDKLLLSTDGAGVMQRDPTCP
jgi:hypothetical protein